MADALARAGVDLGRRVPGEAGQPGILLFDEPTAALCDVLRDSSRAGLERIIAVSVSPAGLADNLPWRLLAAGASDVLVWDSLPNPAAIVAARLSRWRAVDALLHLPEVEEQAVGASPGWIAILRQVVEIAHFTNASVLIVGETGTGKELVARLIHALDARPGKSDFVVLDCASIVPELSGAELFGHERGAFTGAVASRDGVFALADGGTLFLDEVGELPPALQVQLLRVLQERTYKRVGSNVWRHSRFRLVSATNRDLGIAVARGGFRADLLFRIAICVVRLPPLCERPDDILLLARHFLRRICAGGTPPDLDPAVAAYLLQRDYPGNVRDLLHVVARLSGRHVGPGPITLGDVAPEERPPGGWPEVSWRDARFETAIRRALAFGASLREIRHAAEATAVRLAISDEKGSLQRAASRLGMTDRALQMRQAGCRQKPPGTDPAPPR